MARSAGRARCWIFFRWAPGGPIASICWMTRSTVSAPLMSRPSARLQRSARSGSCPRARSRWTPRGSPAFAATGARGSRATPDSARFTAMSVRAWPRPGSNIICRCFTSRPAACLIIYAPRPCWRWMRAWPRPLQRSRPISRRVMNSAAIKASGPYCRRRRCFWLATNSRPGWRALPGSASASPARVLLCGPLNMTRPCPPACPWTRARRRRSGWCGAFWPNLMAGS